ncbi:helix-turn-helix domain-containing protein [Actinokineospora sp.]|uniref:helix-turn-helix domain-containing protein n=1 Tax=Actinokineospora sp. TaxID=1872133 RepID=UPI0040377113
MTRGDPAALRWLVGIELRDRRLRARKTTAAAATLIGTNHSKIVHMETGRYRQKADEVKELLEAYRAPQSEVDRVVALAATDDGPSWWEPWSKVVSEDFAIFLGLEGLAEREFTYDPLLVSALFQTEAYAMALTGLSHRVPLDRQELVVELRMERQRRLTEPVPLKVQSVIEESALRRVAGDGELMREQLERLIELSELSNVTIQILPTAKGIRAATFGDFNLIELASGRQLVYVESLYGAEYVHDRNEVRGYSLMVDSVRADVLDEDDSVALIKQVITETT